MKKSAEVFADLCDKILAGNSMTVSARKCGISNASLFRWIAQSAEDAEGMSFSWGPFGWNTLAGHIKTANRGALAAIESDIYARAAGTSDVQLEPVFYQGRPQFKEREDVIRNGDQNQPPEILMMLYGQPDVFERDANGQRVQLYIRRAPSDALTLALMKAKNPKGGWADINTRNVNLNMTGGVQVISGRKPMPPAVAAPAPLLEAGMAEIVQEAIADDEATAEIEAADAELVPDIGAEPEPETMPEVAEVSAPLDQAAVIEADAADGVKPRPYAAELAKLGQKIKAAAEKQAATPAARYVPLAERGEAWKIAHRDSAEQDHVGSGSPPPGYSGVTR